MEMKTILAILYANGLENVVSKAVAIDNGLDQPIEHKTMRVSIDKDELPKGKAFIDDKRSGYIDCPIIGYNPYKLDSNYLVQYPNGKAIWRSYSEYNATSELAKIIDIAQDITI